MASRNKFEINGVINTDNNVLDNIQLLATASGSFVTWDPSVGKWSVIVNEPGTSVKAFNDSNILGNINVGGSGVNELYNSVLIEYPHKDLRDAVDYITIETLTADRFAGELDNQLNIKLDCINDPVQAQIIATQELKQNRVDKIIQFSSDYTANGLRAGDIIDVDAAAYGFAGKLFRVIQVDEEDTDEGSIIYSINALEYDPDVYVADLTRDLRTKRTGIIPKILNEEAQASDDIDFGNQMGRMLAANLLAGLLNSILDPDTGIISIEPSPEGGLVPETLVKKFEITGATSACEGETVVLTVTGPADCCATSYTVPYEITGINIDTDDIDIPLTGNVTLTDGVGTLSIPISNPPLTEGEEILLVSVGKCNSHEITIKDQYLTTPQYTVTPSAAVVDECQTVTFSITATNINDGDSIPYTITGITAADLDSGSLSGNVTANWCSTGGSVFLNFAADADIGDEIITFTLDGGVASATVTLTDGIMLASSASPASITEGSSSTVTFTITGKSIADGTQVPYTISGSGIGKVATPTLSGVVTLSGNSASINVQTNGNTTDEANQFVGVTFGPVPDYVNCGTTTAQITILDDDPTPAADFSCEYVLVPVVWCGTYDGTTQYLKSVSIRKSAYLPLAPTGGVAVPTTLTVTNPGVNGAAVNIASTVNIDPGSIGAGGAVFEVITAFDPAPSAGDTLLTGTRATFNGYS